MGACVAKPTSTPTPEPTEVQEMKTDGNVIPAEAPLTLYADPNHGIFQAASLRRLDLLPLPRALQYLQSYSQNNALHLGSTQHVEGRVRVKLRIRKKEVAAFVSQMGNVGILNNSKTIQGYSISSSSGWKPSLDTIYELNSVKIGGIDSLYTVLGSKICAFFNCWICLECQRFYARAGA